MLPVWLRILQGPPADDPARAQPPILPLLTHVASPEPTDWLRESMTTFGTTVASNACIYRPFDTGLIAYRWSDVRGSAGVDFDGPGAVADFAMHGGADAGQSRSCVDAILADAPLESVETTATSRW